MPSSSPSDRVQGENQHSPGRAEKKKGDHTLTGTSNDHPVLLNVDLLAWVPEPKPAARDRRDHVALVVHSGKIGDLGVEVRRPGRVADSRLPERDASDSSSRGEVEPHEERIEFRERSAERVTDLRRGETREKKKSGVSTAPPMGDNYFYRG